jgi:hypothetical protein
MAFSKPNLMISFYQNFSKRLFFFLLFLRFYATVSIESLIELLNLRKGEILYLFYFIIFSNSIRYKKRRTLFKVNKILKKALRNTMSNVSKFDVAKQKLILSLLNLEEILVGDNNNYNLSLLETFQNFPIAGNQRLYTLQFFAIRQIAKSSILRLKLSSGGRKHGVKNSFLKNIGKIKDLRFSTVILQRRGLLKLKKRFCFYFGPLTPKDLWRYSQNNRKQHFIGSMAALHRHYSLRLDNLLLKINVANNLKEARQIISEGVIKINGSTNVDVRFVIRAFDVISLSQNFYKKFFLKLQKARFEFNNFKQNPYFVEYNLRILSFIYLPSFVNTIRLPFGKTDRFLLNNKYKRTKI